MSCTSARITPENSKAEYENGSTISAPTDVDGWVRDCWGHCLSVASCSALSAFVVGAGGGAPLLPAGSCLAQLQAGAPAAPAY